MSFYFDEFSNSLTNISEIFSIGCDDKECQIQYRNGHREYINKTKNPDAYKQTQKLFSTMKVCHSFNY